jgi:hypothetical protein
MKKKLLMITTFILTLAVAFIVVPLADKASAATNTCPKGRSHCAYPGQCSLYIDQNNDGYCDRGLPVTTNTPKAAVGSTSQNTNVASSKQDASTANQPVATAGVAANANTTAQANNTVINKIAVDAQPAVSSAAPALADSIYHTIPVIAFSAGLYGLTYVLMRKKIISLQVHRKIWNLVLLIMAVICSLLGLFLMLEIDFRMNIPLPFNMTFWHVEAGAVMGVISVFHILWHWKYFGKMLKMAS